jgi:adenosylcobinamide-phosphate synthase
MGWLITRLRRLAEAWAGDRPWALRLAGGAITLVLVAGSGLAGWGLERLALTLWPGQVLLVVALASALAGRSLEQAIAAVLEALAPAADQAAAWHHAAGKPAAKPDLAAARRRLAWIVGRDTDRLEASGILRALAETASENGVDGLFAPLFWMLVGAGIWSAGLWPCPGRWPWPGASRPPAPSIRCWATGAGGSPGWAAPAPGSTTCWCGCPAASPRLTLPAAAGPLARAGTAAGRLPRRAARPLPQCRRVPGGLRPAGGGAAGGPEPLRRPAPPQTPAGRRPAGPRSGGGGAHARLSRRLQLLWLLAAAGRRAAGFAGVHHESSQLIARRRRPAEAACASWEPWRFANCSKKL